MGVPVRGTFLWVIANLKTDEIDEWIKRMLFGCDDTATVAIISNDIHALFRKACGTAGCKPEEQDKALALLKGCEELEGEWDDLRLYIYYQRRIRKLQSETPSGQNYCKPSAEEWVEDYLKLRRAAMDIWSKAKSTVTEEAVPGLSNIFSEIGEGMDDFSVSLGREQQPSTAVGRSIASLHEQLTLLHTSADNSCPPNLAWAYRQTNRIVFGAPEFPTSFSDILEDREED